LLSHLLETTALRCGSQSAVRWRGGSIAYDRLAEAVRSGAIDAFSCTTTPGIRTLRELAIAHEKPKRFQAVARKMLAGRDSMAATRTAAGWKLAALLIPIAFANPGCGRSPTTGGTPLVGDRCFANRRRPFREHRGTITGGGCCAGMPVTF